MSQFQILYKQKISSSSDVERRCNCLETRKAKRSQAFDFRRGFVFEDPETLETLEPVKKKINPISKNKSRKYTTKKVAVKKQPPPFVVGKVRHKIHSPPFLHGPKHATEPKKRIPLTPIQSFAPKNYKFKANYISKAPLMAKATTPSKPNSSPFTLESLLKKNNKNDNKENYFKNVTVRSTRRREIKDSPTTSLNQSEKPTIIFGRRNLEQEFEKSRKDLTKDLVNFEMKNLKETEKDTKNEYTLNNILNNVRKSLTKISQVFSFEINPNYAKNDMTTETMRLANAEHLKNNGDKSQMLSPNLSSISYSPTGSSPICFKNCKINFDTSPQTEKKDLTKKMSENEEMNSDSTSPTLNQTAIELDSTINFTSNQKISPGKNQEHSPKLPDITSPNNFLNKESTDDSKIEQNSCKLGIIQLHPLDGILQTSVANEPISVCNTNLVVSAGIEANSSNQNQSHKDGEENDLNLLSRLSLSSPEKRESTGILKPSPQSQPHAFNNMATEQDGISKSSVADLPISVCNANLVVGAGIETNSSDQNQSHKDGEENDLNLLSRLSLSSPEKRESTGILKPSPQSQPHALNNMATEQDGISKSSVADVPISVCNANLVVGAGIETNSSDQNQSHKDGEENDLNLLSRLSLSSPEKRESTGILKPSPQSQPHAFNNMATEQDGISESSVADVPISVCNTNLVVSAGIETNSSDQNQSHKDGEENDLNLLSRLSLSSPEKRESTGILKPSPQSQQHGFNNMATEQDEISKSSVADLPISVCNANLVVGAGIETNSSDQNQSHKDGEENDLNLLSRLSLSSPEKRESTGILKPSPQSQPHAFNNMATEQDGISESSVADVPISVCNTNLVVSAGIETNSSDQNQSHKDGEENDLNLLSRLSLSSPEKRESTGILKPSPQSQQHGFNNMATEQDEISKSSVADLPISVCNANLVVGAGIETNSSDQNQSHKDSEENDLNLLSRLSLSSPEKRESTDILTQIPVSSEQDVNVNMTKSDKLDTLDTTRLSSNLENIADETLPKKSSKKVAEATKQINVSSQLSLCSLENYENRTNLPEPSKLENEENKSIDRNMPNSPRRSSRLSKSVKNVFPQAQQPNESPVRVLRRKLVDVTPSPKRRIPEKRNATPRKSPYSLLSSKDYSPKHLAISPLKVLNLRNRQIAVTPSPTKLTPRRLQKPYKDVQEIDEDDSSIVLSINRTTKCNSPPSPQTENLISTENNPITKQGENSPTIHINMQINLSKDSSQIEKCVSKININKEDLHADTASAQSAIPSPIIISLIESPEREKSEKICKPLIQRIPSIVEDKSTIQTIDLLSDDEDESSILLKNILQKYSSINTPSPSKSKDRSSTSTQNLPVDEEERSTFLSNILKKYSSINTPSPKSKNRSALTPIENMPIIRISPSKSPCIPEVRSPQKIDNSPLRTLALRRRLVDVTPSPKKIPKKKINVTPCKSPRHALYYTNENSPQQTESPLRVLCLRQRKIAVTPSPKKSTPRRKKNNVQ